MATLVRQLRGFRLTTAEILYHLPITRACSRATRGKTTTSPPNFPRCAGSSTSGATGSKGSLHSVTVASTHLVSAGELRLTPADLMLH